MCQNTREENIIRIAFSGAQGVGKSTLCEYLKKRLQTINPERRIAIIGNISRYLISTHNVRSDVKSSLDDYYLYNAEYIKRYLNTNVDITIHDRTLLDSLAYQLYNNNASDNYYKMLKEIVKWYIMDIDYYYILPIEFEIPADGVRYVNVSHQRQIDKIILKLLEEFGIHYTLLSGDIETRSNIVITMISSKHS